MNQEIIVKLKELQEIDHKINRLEHDCIAKSGSLDEKHEHVQNLQRIVSDKKEKAKKVKMEIDKKDLELKTNEEKIKKLTVQLNTVRTNKEYSLLTGEIKSARADNEVIEDVLLNFFNQNDVIQKEIADLEAKIKLKKEEIESLSNKIKEEVNQLKKEIEALQTKRHSNIDRVDIEILGRYEKIVKSKQDKTALARVVTAQHGRHEYNCGSCYMDIPPQQVIELQRNREGKDMILCKNCSRILYIEVDAADPDKS